jgi:putative transposase
LKAQYRYSIIKTLIQNPGDGNLVKQIVEQTGISKTTLYRWLDIYNQSQKLSSLVPLQKGGKGIGRISKEIEEIIKCSIEDIFLSRQKKSIQKVCIEVINRCKNAGIDPPHVNTIRNRI